MWMSRGFVRLKTFYKDSFFVVCLFVAENVGWMSTENNSIWNYVQRYLYTAMEGFPGKSNQEKRARVHP